MSLWDAHLLLIKAHYERCLNLYWIFLSINARLSFQIYSCFHTCHTMFHYQRIATALLLNLLTLSKEGFIALPVAATFLGVICSNHFGARHDVRILPSVMYEFALIQYWIALGQTKSSHDILANLIKHLTRHIQNFVFASFQFTTWFCRSRSGGDR